MISGPFIKETIYQTDDPSKGRFIEENKLLKYESVKKFTVK